VLQMNVGDCWTAMLEPMLAGRWEPCTFVSQETTWLLQDVQDAPIAVGDAERDSLMRQLAHLYCTYRLCESSVLQVPGQVP
jgi:hypothetical protein